MLQFPLSLQVTIADSDRLYPLSHLYLVVPPNMVLDGVSEFPLEIDGGRLHDTAAHIQYNKL